jgi:hypothetical protein
VMQGPAVAPAIPRSAVAEHTAQLNRVSHSQTKAYTHQRSIFTRTSPVSNVESAPTGSCGCCIWLRSLRPVAGLQRLALRRRRRRWLVMVLLHVGKGQTSSVRASITGWRSLTKERRGDDAKDPRFQDAQEISRKARFKES